MSRNFLLEEITDSFIEDLITEWAYRVDDGMPTFWDQSKVNIFRQILKESLNLTEREVRELFEELDVLFEDDYGPGDVWQTDAGNWRAENPDGNRKSFGPDKSSKDKATRYASGEDINGEDEDSSSESDAEEQVEINDSEHMVDTYAQAEHSSSPVYQKVLSL